MKGPAGGYLSMSILVSLKSASLMVTADWPKASLDVSAVSLSASELAHRPVPFPRTVDRGLRPCLRSSFRNGRSSNWKRAHLPPSSGGKVFGKRIIKGLCMDSETKNFQDFSNCPK